MLELLKLLKSLLAKGYATKYEKEKVASLYKELKDEEEKDTVKEDVEEVEKLPEEEGSEEEEEAKKFIGKLVADSVEEKVEKIKLDVKSFISEQKELAAKKVGVYNSDVKAVRKNLNDSIRAIGYKMGYGNVKNASPEVQALMKEMTTDATGTPFAGYVVDSELSAEIRHLMTEYGVARREMTTVQLSKNSYKVNELVTDATVYWVDEAGAIKSTQVVLGQEELTLNKLAAIVSFTNELLEDQEIDLVTFVASRVAELFAQKEDLAFFTGDGTSTYGDFTGLLNDTNVSEVTMAGTTFVSMDADDLIDMVDSTPQGALANSKFYMHRSIMTIIRKLKDDNGEYIYQRPSESGPATIWGYPVVLVEAMPSITDTAADTSFVLFGDLKKGCILGYKGAIKAKMFDAGTVRNAADSADINLITTDRQAVRWTSRVGYIQIITTLNNPITKLTTAAASA